MIHKWHKPEKKGLCKTNFKMELRNNYNFNYKTPQNKAQEPKNVKPFKEICARKKCFAKQTNMKIMLLTVSSIIVSLLLFSSFALNSSAQTSPRLGSSTSSGKFDEDCLLFFSFCGKQQVFVSHLYLVRLNVFFFSSFFSKKIASKIKSCFKQFKRQLFESLLEINRKFLHRKFIFCSLISPWKSKTLKHNVLEIFDLRFENGGFFLSFQRIDGLKTLSLCVYLYL